MRMTVKVILTEPYYREFHKRKGIVFDDAAAIQIYRATQDLQKNWPACLSNAKTPPDVVKAGDFYYLRFNFSPPQQIKFRICFGVDTKANGDVEVVGLTCRTKQELAGGSKTGTQAWKKHMQTVGKARWNEYRRGQIRSWQIY
jgi:hypothetical protein